MTRYKNRAERAEKTLELHGFIDKGGEYWTLEEKG